MKRTRGNWSRVEKLLSEFYGIYSSSRLLQLTREELSTKKADLWQRVLQDGRTHSEVAYLKGYDRAMWHQLFREMVWRLGTAGGPLPEDQKWDYSSGAPTHGAYFWKGSNKPFTKYILLDESELSNGIQEEGPSPSDPT